MSASSFIAGRFLRHRRSNRSQRFISFVTLIAVTGVMLGVASLIIALTILGGFEHELTAKVIGFTTHLQVNTYSGRPIRDPDSIAERIRTASPHVRSVSPFIAKEGMVSYGDLTEGIMLKGTGEEGAERGIQTYLVEGKDDRRQIDEGLYGCVAGRKLLRTIGAGLHDTVLVFGLQGSMDNIVSPNVVAFVVNGIYESGMGEYDDVYLYTSIPAAQQLTNMMGAVGGFEVMLDRAEEAPEAAKVIMEGLGYPYSARTLYQLYRNLFTWIQLQKEPIPIILGLIIAVAAVNIIGTLLMLVLEKRRQIGILRSLGATQGDIQRIFLINGAVIAVTGTLLGNAVGFLVCWSQQQFQFFSLPSSIYFMKSVPIRFQASDFIIVSVISILLCILAAWIPARLASRLDPVRSIKLG